MPYVGTEPVPKITKVRTYGTLGSATTTIPVPGGFTPGNIEVFINGGYVLPTDYDESDGLNVVFTDTLDAGTDYIVIEARAFEVSNAPTLEGGSQANFVTMPQVGGDPIVESGSNSDGEWTRWADGRAMVVAEFNVDMTVTGNQTPLGAFAIPLLNTASDLITGGGSKSHDEGISIAERDSFKNSFLFVTSGAWVFSCDGTGANSSKPMTAFAIGRWK